MIDWERVVNGMELPELREGPRADLPPLRAWHIADCDGAWLVNDSGNFTDLRDLGFKSVSITLDNDML